MKSYSPYQFTFFRIILGTYLCFHFVDLIAYAPEIWSNVGLLPNPELNLTHGIFPNLLNYFDGPIQAQLFVGFLGILALLFLVGFQRPLISLLLWYGWVCLFDRNNLIGNPGIPYIGWILLCCAAVPKGEPLSFSKSKNGVWKFPFILFFAAWALMAVGYTISGVDKFQSPSWYDGSAIFHLLENPLARDWWLREFLLSLPQEVLKINTWAVLGLEMIFLPLAIIKYTRKWVWLAMIFMHLGILMIVDFADLTLGMLMIHWFTFDSRWLKPKAKQSGIVFFDGVCSVCNAFIDFLISNDTGESLRYAPLQGETATQQLPLIEVEGVKTVIFKQDGKIYKESDAALRTIASMGGIWRLALVLMVVPRFIRNAVYRYVAKNRYKWFGQRETCRMPTPEERDKILG